METIIMRLYRVQVFRGYSGTTEKTKGNYRDYRGLSWGNIVIMEKIIETTVMRLYGVSGLGVMLGQWKRKWKLLY